jgi:hypothetical protein
MMPSIFQGTPRGCLNRTEQSHTVTTLAIRAEAASVCGSMMTVPSGVHVRSNEPRSGMRDV